MSRGPGGLRDTSAPAMLRMVRSAVRSVAIGWPAAIVVAATAGCGSGEEDTTGTPAVTTGSETTSVAAPAPDQGRTKASKPSRRSNGTGGQGPGTRFRAAQRIAPAGRGGRRADPATAVGSTRRRRRRRNPAPGAARGPGRGQPPGRDRVGGYGPEASLAAVDGGRFAEPVPRTAYLMAGSPRAARTRSATASPVRPTSSRRSAGLPWVT